jgi:hypothetical protein
LKILLHRSIEDTFEQIGLDVKDYLLTLFERVNWNSEAPCVDFSINNATMLDTQDTRLIEYLKMNDVDVDNVLSISTALCAKYINFIREYHKIVEKKILGE